VKGFDVAGDTDEAEDLGGELVPGAVAGVGGVESAGELAIEDVEGGACEVGGGCGGAG
jgi:hypothetical protein